MFQPRKATEPVALLLRILYLHQYFNTPEGGGSLRSWHIARQWAAQGHHVHVVTTWNGAVRHVQQHDNLTITRLPITYHNRMDKLARMRAFMRFVWEAYQEGRQWLPFDRVFATSTPLTIGIAALLLRRFHQVPFIFEVRDLWPEAPIQLGFVKGSVYKWLLRLLEKRIYNRAEKVIALSPGMAAGVKSTGTNTPVEVVPNFADTDFFSPSRQPQAYQEALKDKQPGICICYTGAFGYANDIPTLLDFAAYCQAEKTNAYFVLAGDGAYKKWAVKECADRGLSRVSFLPHLSTIAVRNLLWQSDYAWVGFRPEPVLQTNSPNKFFDAMAAQTPVLLSVRGWIDELVQEKRCGLSVVDRQNWKAVLEHLETEASTLAENCRLVADMYRKDDLLKKLAL